MKIDRVFANQYGNEQKIVIQTRTKVIHKKVSQGYDKVKLNIMKSLHMNLRLPNIC